MEPPQQSTMQMQESEGKESPGMTHRTTPQIQVKDEGGENKGENDQTDERNQQHEQSATIIASQRHRMITETGHIRYELCVILFLRRRILNFSSFSFIREIAEGQSEHYSQTSEQQYHQQNLVQQYAHTPPVSSDESYHQNVAQHSRSPRDIPPTNNDKLSNGNNHVLLPPNQHQAIYLQVKDNEEYFRYQNALPQIVRYDPNAERYHPRYHPYQHHASPHVSQTSSSIKTELENEQNSQQTHPQHMVYQMSESSTTQQEPNQVLNENATESKVQYTNLEPMQNVSASQSYYTSIQEYQTGAGNVTYLPPKEYYAIQAGSSPPNNVLYKSKCLLKC